MRFYFWFWHELLSKGNSAGINSGCHLHPWDDSFQICRQTEGQQGPPIASKVINHLLMSTDPCIKFYFLIRLRLTIFEQVEIGNLFFFLLCWWCLPRSLSSRSFAWGTKLGFVSLSKDFKILFVCKLASNLFCFLRAFQAMYFPKVEEIFEIKVLLLVCL